MLSRVQFLVGQDGQPQYAVIPFSEYERLVASLEPSAVVRPSLLSPDKTKIALPNGGPGAYIDLVRFADYLARRGTINIAINQRAQALDKFPADQQDTLDPFIRRHFLASDSPYKNTMQATNDVVDALVESGLFTRTKRSYEYFYRPVNSLDINQDALLQFIQENGHPQNPIVLFT